jgi:hypothetical protein
MALQVESINGGRRYWVANEVWNEGRYTKFRPARNEDLTDRLDRLMLKTTFRLVDPGPPVAIQVAPPPEPAAMPPGTFFYFVSDSSREDRPVHMVINETRHSVSYYRSTGDGQSTITGIQKERVRVFTGNTPPKDSVLGKRLIHAGEDRGIVKAVSFFAGRPPVYWTICPQPAGDAKIFEHTLGSTYVDPDAPLPVAAYRSTGRSMLQDAVCCGLVHVGRFSRESSPFNDREENTLSVPTHPARLKKTLLEVTIPGFNNGGWGLMQANLNQGQMNLFGHVLLEVGFVDTLQWRNPKTGHTIHTLFYHKVR